MKDTVKAFVEHTMVQRFIIVLIVINAIILGMETSKSLMQACGYWLTLANQIILYTFVVELLLRFFVYRLRFFTQPWSLFDAAVVLIALIPASQAFSALRALRVLRVLRLLSTVPTMRKVIEGLLSAIPGIASVASIMLLFFYVFAVVGTHLYGATFPQWFGTLGNTMYTLFQIMTLESWSMGIVRPVMESYPFAWVFFVPFILVTTFVVVNLVVGLVVNSMQDAHHAEADERTDTYRDDVLGRLAEIERLLKER